MEEMRGKVSQDRGNFGRCRPSRPSAASDTPTRMRAVLYPDSRSCRRKLCSLLCIPNRDLLCSLLCIPNRDSLCSLLCIPNRAAAGVVPWPGTIPVNREAYTTKRLSTLDAALGLNHEAVDHEAYTSEPLCASRP